MLSLIHRGNGLTRQFSHSRQSALDDWFGWGLTRHSSWFSPDVDAKETENSYVFELDLPGVREEDLDISLKSNTLTISGKREREEKEENTSYCACERSYGSFNRTFTLPDVADSEAVSAELKNGVLTVAVGKRPEAKPKQITIKAS